MLELERFAINLIVIRLIDIYVENALGSEFGAGCQVTRAGATPALDLGAIQGAQNQIRDVCDELV